MMLSSLGFPPTTAPRIPGMRSTAAGLSLALAAGLSLAAADDAAAQDVTFSVVPTYEEVRWDDAFGLERARFPGIRASIDFGPWFSLAPFYARARDLGPRDDFTPTEGSTFAELFDVDVFGADLQVTLLPGPVAPFIRGGGGVLRTDDEVEGRRDRVMLRAGGGVSLGLGERARAELYAENWATRLRDPLIPGAVSADELDEDGIVSSLVLGAGLRVPLGAGPRDAGQGPGLLPGIFLEPHASRIEWDDALRLGRQYAVGARGGVDFNRNVGLRATWWRGVDDDFGEWVGMEGIGAEAQFYLGGGSGLSPFLVAGAGRISFDDDFEDLDGATRSRLDHLTLGGGLAFGLGDRTRLELGARNFLTTVGEELEDVTDPDELVSNWHYSAGLSVAFGARHRTGAERDFDRERARVRALEIELEAERARQRSRIADPGTPDAVGAEREIHAAQIDRLAAELEALREENRRLRAGDVDVPVTEPGERIIRPGQVPGTITIPVPEVGEIILRYGEAYAVRSAEGAGPLTEEEAARLERRIEEALGDRLRVAQGDTAAVARQLDLLEARLPGIVRGIVREELRSMGVQPGAPAVAPPAAPPVAEPAARDPDAGFLEARSVTRLAPYSGLQLSSPTQLLAGMRVGLGDVSSAIPVELVPEIAFGVGEGDPSLLLALNGRFGWQVGGSRSLEPYLIGGVGLTNRRFLSVNLGYGAALNVNPPGGIEPLRLFIEHQGIGFYDEHRLLVGVSLPRR
jgi:hypothetical protein